MKLPQLRICYKVLLGWNIGSAIGSIVFKDWNALPLALQGAALCGSILMLLSVIRRYEERENRPRNFQRSRHPEHWN